MFKSFLFLGFAPVAIAVFLVPHLANADATQCDVQMSSYQSEQYESGKDVVVPATCQFNFQPDEANEIQSFLKKNSRKSGGSSGEEAGQPITLYGSLYLSAGASAGSDNKLDAFGRVGMEIVPGRKGRFGLGIVGEVGDDYSAVGPSVKMRVGRRESSDLTYVTLSHVAGESGNDEFERTMVEFSFEDSYNGVRGSAGLFVLDSDNDNDDGGGVVLSLGFVTKGPN